MWTTNAPQHASHATQDEIAIIVHSFAITFFSNPENFYRNYANRVSAFNSIHIRSQCVCVYQIGDSAHIFESIIIIYSTQLLICIHLLGPPNGWKCFRERFPLLSNGSWCEGSFLFWQPDTVFQRQIKNRLLVEENGYSGNKARNYCRRKISCFVVGVIWKQLMFNNFNFSFHFFHLFLSDHLSTSQLNDNIICHSYFSMKLTISTLSVFFSQLHHRSSTNECVDFWATWMTADTWMSSNSSHSTFYCRIQTQKNWNSMRETATMAGDHVDGERCWHQQNWRRKRPFYHRHSAAMMSKFFVLSLYIHSFVRLITRNHVTKIYFINNHKCKLCSAMRVYKWVVMPSPSISTWTTSLGNSIGKLMRNKAKKLCRRIPRIFLFRWLFYSSDDFPVWRKHYIFIFRLFPAFRARTHADFLKCTFVTLLPNIRPFHQTNFFHFTNAWQRETAKGSRGCWVDREQRWNKRNEFHMQRNGYLQNTKIKAKKLKNKNRKSRATYLIDLSAFIYRC